MMKELIEREAALKAIDPGYGEFHSGNYNAIRALPAAQVTVKPPRKQFPVLNSDGAKVDWQLVADHGEQAHNNHGQSVERLAERGGLGWCELFAVLHNRPWAKIDTNEAMLACRALEARYLAALNVAPVSLAEAARDKIARIITLDHLQLLYDFDVDGDLYRLDPECAEAAYATADAILRAIAGEQP